jgi:protein-tyrosine-phosphatase/DNA-binding transcriptional ArsR family regulator
MKSERQKRRRSRLETPLTNQANSRPARRSAKIVGLSEASSTFGALANETRLEIFRLLVRYLPYGLAAGDIGRLLAVQHNTLSAHLAALERVGLLRSRREGRSIIFAAVEARAYDIVDYLAEGLPVDVDRQARRLSSSFPAKRNISARERPFNVLLLCTANSARSIFAEAILNREGAGRFRPFSAGSHPRAQPNSMAIALLSQLGYDVSPCRSKSWNEFAGEDSPQMDFIVTVCDVAAREPAPLWPGDPIRAHWGIPDPIMIGGSEAEWRAAMLEAYRRLTQRVTSFVNLDVERLDRATLQRKLVEIGLQEGATEMTLQRTSSGAN